MMSEPRSIGGDPDSKSGDEEIRENNRILPRIFGVL